MKLSTARHMDKKVIGYEVHLQMNHENVIDEEDGF